MPQNFYRKHKGTIRKVVKGAGYAYQAIQLASKVAALINVEQKYFDRLEVGTQDTTPSVNLLSDIDQGTDVNARIGNSIAIKSLYFKCNIIHNPDSAFQRVRLLLVEDKNDNHGVAPTGTSILKSAEMLSFLNKDNSMRYKVLMDKLVTVDANQPIKSLKKYFKFGGTTNEKGKVTVWNKHMTWYGPSGGDTAKGHIYLLQFSDNTTHQPTIETNMRLKYIDN